MTQSTRKPNIVLLGIDSLRADHLSGYGYARLTSPHLDRFAQQGVLFENTFSAHIPTTSAGSLACHISAIITGRFSPENCRMCSIFDLTVTLKDVQ